jgi:cell division protein ZapA
MSAPATVTVRILDKDYQVACPEDERAALLAAADHLNRRMREIRDAGKVVGLDRMAVMVALNLASELLAAQGQALELREGLAGRLNRLCDRADLALAQGRQYEIQ